MTSTNWVPYVAIAAGGMLLLKAVLIIGSGGNDFGPLTGLLYLAGALLALAAAIGTGMRQRIGRRALVGTALTVLVVLWFLGLGDLLTPVFQLFSPEEYVNDEGPIGLIGLVLLALGARAKIGQREPVPA